MNILLGITVFSIIFVAFGVFVLWIEWCGENIDEPLLGFVLVLGLPIALFLGIVFAFAT